MIKITNREAILLIIGVAVGAVGWEILNEASSKKVSR